MKIANLSNRLFVFLRVFSWIISLFQKMSNVKSICAEKI